MTGTVRVRGRLVLPYDEVADGVVAVEAGSIVYAGPTQEWLSGRPDEALPDPVGTVLPGLVDLHCHGGGGDAVTTTDPDSARAVAEHHAGYGTTRLTASLVTAAPQVLLEQVRTLAPLVREGVFAGIHLEGPFLSRDRCGAQAPEFLTVPDTGLVDSLLAEAGGTVRSMTLAPELPGAAAVTAQLSDAGVVVALGHSDASYPVFRAALRDLGGRGLVTHLGNGMPPFHHRSVGPVGASLTEAAAGRAVVEVIGDGMHVDDGFVALVFAAAAPDAVVLVTDAMAAAGMPDGIYELGPQRVQVLGGVARLDAEGRPQGGGSGSREAASIAGGTAHLVEIVACAVRDAGVPLVDAVRAASHTPARVLGIAHDAGALLPGCAGDLVVVDDDLRPLRVMRRGRWLT